MFGGISRQGTDTDFVPGVRVQRKSTGYCEFIRSISRDEGLKILDLGATSPAHITFMTGLGHKFHQEDALRAAADKSLITPGDQGGSTIDVERFMNDNL